MITWTSFFTIIGMMLITYATRLIGYFALRGRQLSPQTAHIMEAAPACVLLSIIAPHFVSDKPNELISIFLTTFCATRFPMLPTVIIAITSSAFFAWLLN